MKLALAAVMALTIATPAIADECTKRGFMPGTFEYLECWRYVNQQTEHNNDEAYRWGERARDWAQPQGQRTYACTDQYGRLVTCIR